MPSLVITPGVVLDQDVGFGDLRLGDGEVPRGFWILRLSGLAASKQVIAPTGPARGKGTGVIRTF